MPGAFPNWKPVLHVDLLGSQGGYTVCVHECVSMHLYGAD